jgi:hypothetical protein
MTSVWFLSCAQFKGTNRKICTHLYAASDAYDAGFAVRVDWIVRVHRTGCNGVIGE